MVWLRFMLVLVTLWHVHGASLGLDAEIQRLKAGTTNCPNSGQLCICAFKITTFGKAKMDKPHVVEVLIEIINAYDIVLIQEIRDADEVAIWDLLDQCNDANDDDFAMELSVRLGSSPSYKEQYAYFYRASKFDVDDTYHYPVDTDDPDSVPGFYDDFERPPFSVLFSSKTGSQIQRFGYVGIHVKPDNAPEEIDSLVDVYDFLRGEWAIDDIFLGGDFSAGCSYVSDSDWEWIRLRTDSRFLWAIGDDANTTVGSECPYDRLVLAGSALRNAYVCNSGNVYYFDEHLDLNQTHTSEVSDHYPVEMRLR